MKRLCPVIFLFIFISCKKDQPEKITYRQVVTGISGNLNALGRWNDSILIAGGEHQGEGTAVISTNNGNNWNILPGRTEGAITALLVVDSLCWYAGTSAPHAYKTTNGGMTWEKLWVNTSYAPNYRKPVRRIVRTGDATIYFVLGGDFEAGGIWKTYDGGTIWKAHTFNFELRDLDFENENTGYACGFGNMVQTKDGGETWTYNPCSNAYFMKMNYNSNNKWWCVSFNGGVYSSPDPSSGWDEKMNAARLFGGRKNLNGLLWDGDMSLLFGENGLLIKGSPSGTKWHEASCCNEAEIRDLIVSEVNYIACGRNGNVYLIERN